MSLAAALASVVSPDRLLHWLCAFAAPAGTDRAGAQAPEDDDHACLRRVAAGDPDALQPLFDRWKLPLLSFFYRALGSRPDAEDLALQTFDRVYRAAARYRPDAKFSAWLFTIARHELRHELRRRRRKPVEAVAPEDLALLAVDASPAERRRAAELEEQLLAALQELPERQRSALLLTAAGDLSHAEIAGTLGVSESNLHVILHRARHALRSLFPLRP
ncbi:MAG TPA: sigma-70 family RNA polymerase sigma factor [Opitutaceae bacterium]|nr:sigma-70 family RNA polymerase sigma factor [Opitutaceae bacterium]